MQHLIRMLKIFVEVSPGGEIKRTIEDVIAHMEKIRGVLGLLRKLLPDLISAGVIPPALQDEALQLQRMLDLIEE